MCNHSTSTLALKVDVRREERFFKICSLEVLFDFSTIGDSLSALLHDVITGFFVPAAENEAENRQTVANKIAKTKVLEALRFILVNKIN